MVTDKHQKIPALSLHYLKLPYVRFSSISLYLAFSPNGINNCFAVPLTFLHSEGYYFLLRRDYFLNSVPRIATLYTRRIIPREMWDSEKLCLIYFIHMCNTTLISFVCTVTLFFPWR